MKELWKLSLNGLKTSRLKSVLLYISLILCVCLITTLMILKCSFENYQKQVYLQSNGDYLFSMNIDDIDKLKNDNMLSFIQDFEVLYEIGLAKQENQFVNIKGLNKESKLHTVTIINGKKPTTTSEVMVSEDYSTLHNLNIGDTITINIGNRLYNNKPLTNSDSYIENESFQTTNIMKNMKISGIYEPIIVSGEQIYTDEMIIFQKEPTKKGIMYATLMDNEVETWEEIKSKYIEIIQVNTYGEKLFLGVVEQSRMVYMIELLIILISFMIFSLLYQIFSSAMEEQKTRIGLLQSIGMSDLQVFGIYIIKDLLTAIFCIPIGVICAYISSYFYLYMMNEALKKSSKIIVEMVRSLPISIIIQVFIIFICIIVIARMFSFYRIRKLYPIELILNRPKKGEKYTYKSRLLIEKFIGIEAVIGKCYRKENKRKYVGVFLSSYITLVLFIIASLLLFSTNQQLSVNKKGINIAFETVHTQSDYRNINEIIKQMKELDNIYDMKSNSSIILNDVKLSMDGIDSSFVDEHNISTVLCIQSMETTDFYMDGNEVILDDQYSFQDESGNIVSASYYETKPLEIKFTVNGDQKGIKEDFILPVMREDIPYPSIQKELVKENDNIITLYLYVSNETMSKIIQKLETIQVEGIHTTSTFYGEEQKLLKDLKLFQSEYPQYISGIVVEQDIQKQNQATMNAYFYIIVVITLLVLMISILNLFCIMLSNIVTKIKDFMLLESIGLERKQMIKLLFFEHVITLMYALFFALFTVWIIYPLLCRMIFTNNEKYSMNIFILLIVCIVICLLGVLLLSIGYRYSQKQNISECLRME